MLSDLKLLLGISGTEQDNLLTLLINIAKDLALRTINPFDSELSKLLLPSKYNFWVVLASKEMYQNMGNENVRSYSENGLSISYKDLTSGISKDLLGQLIAKVGIPE